LNPIDRPPIQIPTIAPPLILKFLLQSFQYIIGEWMRDRQGFLVVLRLIVYDGCIQRSGAAIMQGSTVNISLGPEYAQLIQVQLERGRFSSAEDVVGHALQLLDNEQEYDPLWLEETREKIAIGLAQIENGQVLDGKTVIEGLRAKVQAAREAQA
jgi:antitoxin ParD1/3/4